MFKSIIQLLPGLIGLIGKLVGGAKKPPKRADEILGKADEPTQSKKAQDEARKRAADKYGR